MSCQHTAAAVHIQNKCVASSASLKNSKTDNASLQIKINYERERETERIVEYSRAQKFRTP